MVYWNQNYKDTDVKDIRSEPTNVPIMLMSLTMEISRNIPRVIENKKLSIYSLLGIRYQLRVLHALTRTRSNLYYNQEYRKLLNDISLLEKSKVFWTEAETNQNNFLKYLDLLMDLLDLEITLFERFNLVPAEDEEIEWPEIDYKALGLEQYA